MSPIFKHSELILLEATSATSDMSTTTKKRMVRCDSLTGIDKADDDESDCASSDDVDSFEDAQESVTCLQSQVNTRQC